MIIEGENAVLGRLATQVAKKALRGEQIHIVNCEKIIVSGSKKTACARYFRLRTMGVPRKGPFVSTNPEKFVKRILRGMLPYKQEKGRSALTRIKCHKGIPSAFEGKEFEKIAQSQLIVESCTIAEICKYIGGKE